MVMCAVPSAIVLLTESMTAACALLPPVTTTAMPAAPATTMSASRLANKRRRGRRPGVGSAPPTNVSVKAWFATAGSPHPAGADAPITGASAGATRSLPSGCAGGGGGDQ